MLTGTIFISGEVCPKFVFKKMGKGTKIVKNIPFKAKKLAKKFWPGPLTLVLVKKNNISSLSGEVNSLLYLSL